MEKEVLSSSAAGDSAKATHPSALLCGGCLGFDAPEVGMSKLTACAWRTKVIRRKAGRSLTWMAARVESNRFRAVMNSNG